MLNDAFKNIRFFSLSPPPPFCWFLYFHMLPNCHKDLVGVCLHDSVLCRKKKEWMALPPNRLCLHFICQTGSHIYFQSNHRPREWADQERFGPLLIISWATFPELKGHVRNQDSGNNNRKTQCGKIIVGICYKNPPEIVSL